MDTVPESDSEDEAAASRSARASRVQQRLRTRANTDTSEPLLAFDEYGHHKPVKHNKAAQMCGPYQLSRVNLLQSNSSRMPNRSVDDLLHHGRKTGDAPRSSQSPAAAAAAAACGGPGQDQPKTRSEAASPLLTGIPSLSRLSGRLPPLDLSRIERPPYVPNSADFFGSYSDYEQPMFSAGLSASSVDWSHYDGLEFASGSRADNAVDFAPSNYSHPQSNGFDFSGSEQMHTLTTNTSTSGDLSEVEDLMPNSLEEYEFDAAAACGGDGGVYSTSATSSGFDMMAAQMNLLAGSEYTALKYDDLLAENLAGGRAEDGIGNKPTTMATLARVEDSPLMNATGMPMNMAVFSGVDDAPAFWVDTPPHGLPILGDMADPDPALASFWEPR